MCNLVMARQNVRMSSGGARSLLRKGTVVCVDDPVVRGREHLFRPVDVTHHCGEGPVEQATAAPGEKRSLTAAGRIREWARSHGYDVPDRGKLPSELTEAYRQAHQEPEVE